MSTKPILLVDDEVKVLNSLSRTLSEENFDEIITTQDGKSALEIIRKRPDIALIISDFRMPGMNGVELLAQVRQNAPDVTRILLTGAADLEMAMDAINKGNIFRFLLKPCAPADLLTAIKSGLRQNELINAEKELLRKTLYGSIKVLIDILSVLSPTIFTQAGRLRSLARDLASALHLEDQSWEIELAALLSQIGAVTIPHDILESWQKGEPLDETRTKMIQSIPRMGKILINNIPRLENIAEAIGYQNYHYSTPANPTDPTAENIPVMARILKIVIDFDHFNVKSSSPSVAFQKMSSNESAYDPNILVALRLKLQQLYNRSSYSITGTLKGEKEIYVDGIRLGMVLSRDIIDKNGDMIIPKGILDNEVLLYKLTNYLRSLPIIEPIFIESGF